MLLLFKFIILVMVLTRGTAMLNTTDINLNITKEYNINGTENAVLHNTEDNFKHLSTEVYNVNNETDNIVPFDIFIVFGPDNPYFNMIHYTALVCLVISNIISFYTVIYSVRSSTGRVFSWKIGQRLVFYLAVADLILNFIHFTDHMYSVLQIKKGFEEFCMFAAFLLNTSAIAQSIFVMITALSAFTSVTFNKNIYYGKYDLGLLLSAYGIPTIIGCVLLGLDWLGPSGFWCHGDNRKSTGSAVFTIFSSGVIITFCTNIICYVGVFITIVSTTKRMNKFKDKSENKDGKNYNKTIRILVLFVVAYMAQWWPLVIYTIWSYLEDPHIAIIELVVIFANLGGLFNYVAYTFVRRRSSSDSSKQRSQSSHSGLSTSVTSVSVTTTSGR